MKSFNWRVAAPNTLRMYHVAIKDFETVTGIPVDRADAVSISAWQQSMQARKLALNTIRSRLSAIVVVSGVKVELPRKQKAAGRKILTLEQVRILFVKIEKKQDRFLMGSLLMTGAQPQTIDAHLIGSAVLGQLTTQEVTRKIKRYARLAGLQEADMNLRTLIHSGQVLLKEHGMAALVKTITPIPADHPTVAWRPLHGIGRRTHAIKA